MPWTAPKMDWDTNPTNPLPSDFNRIEGNIDFLNIDIETKKGLVVDALSSVGIAALIADTHVQIASKITGAKKTSIRITPGIANKEIPKGIYDTGGGVVEGDVNLIGANIKPGVSIFGVAGAIPSKGASIITPGTANQIIASGQYLTGDQTIAGDPDLISSNIKSGVNIFGVAGNSNVVETSAGDATAAQILSGKRAYVDGALVTGTIPSKGAATITPGTTAQTIAAGQYLSGIQTIAGDTDLVADNIKSGANIFGVGGTFNGPGIKRILRYENRNSATDPYIITLPSAVVLANTFFVIIPDELRYGSSTTERVIVKFLNSTQLSVSCVSTSNRMAMFQLFIIEFNPEVIKSKQVVTLPNDIWTDYVAYTINAVDVNKTIVLANGIAMTGGPNGYIQDSTTLMAMTYAFGSTTVLSELQVIEFY